MSHKSNLIAAELIKRGEELKLASPSMNDEMRNILKIHKMNWFEEWNKEQEKIFSTPTNDILLEHCPQSIKAINIPSFISLKNLAFYVINAIESNSEKIKPLKPTLERLINATSRRTKAEIRKAILKEQNSLGLADTSQDTQYCFNIFSKAVTEAEVLYRGSDDNKAYIQWLAPLSAHKQVTKKCSICHSGPDWKCASNLMNRHGLAHLNAKDETFIGVVLELEPKDEALLFRPNVFINIQGEDENDFINYHRFFIPKEKSDHDGINCGQTFNLESNQTQSVPEWISIDDLVVSNIWLVLNPTDENCLAEPHQTNEHWKTYQKELL